MDKKVNFEAYYQEPNSNNARPQFNQFVDHYLQQEQANPTVLHRLLAEISELVDYLNFCPSSGSDNPERAEKTEKRLIEIMELIQPHLSLLDKYLIDMSKLLIAVAGLGSESLLTQILKHRPNLEVEVVRITPINYAIHFRQKNNLSLLLKAGAKPDGLVHDITCPPLTAAITNNDPDAVQLLLANGASLDGGLLSYSKTKRYGQAKMSLKNAFGVRNSQIIDSLLPYYESLPKDCLQDFNEILRSCEISSDKQAAIFSWYKETLLKLLDKDLMITEPYFKYNERPLPPYINTLVNAARMLQAQGFTPQSFINRLMAIYSTQYLQVLEMRTNLDAVSSSELINTRLEGILGDNTELRGLLEVYNVLLKDSVLKAVIGRQAAFDKSMQRISSSKAQVWLENSGQASSALDARDPLLMSSSHTEVPVERARGLSQQVATIGSQVKVNYRR